MSDIMYNVKNRSTSQVFYKIPEDGIRRSFRHGETKKIPYSEIVKLMYQPGGPELLTNYLQVTRDVTEQLNIPTQPEYFMSEMQVRDLLLTGSYDAFLDALDYAPAGVKDLIIGLAIELPLTDIQKKDAIKAKWGMDIDTMLRHIKEEKEEEGATAKAAAPTTAPTTGRRTNVTYEIPVENKEETTSTSTSKYNIIG